MSEQRPVVSVVSREGSFIYSDDSGRENVRAVAHVSATAYFADDAHLGHSVCWRQLGSLPMIAEALATMYFSQPGLKDIVDGIYSALMKRSGRMQ